MSRFSWSKNKTKNEIFADYRLIAICTYSCNGTNRGRTNIHHDNQWKQAFESENVHALMQVYAEDFVYEDPEATNKEELRQIKASGMMSSVEIDLSTAKLELSDQTAKIYLYNNEGEVDMGFMLTKEIGKSWLITGTPYEQCTCDRYNEAYGDDCIEFDGYFRC